MIRGTPGTGSAYWQLYRKVFQNEPTNRGTRPMLFGIPNAVHRGARLIRGRGRDRAIADGSWLSRDEAIMGTAIRVELWSDDRAAGVAAIAAVMAEMHRIDRAMSPFKPDSELSRINRDAAAKPVVVSDEMFRLLERAVAFSQLSGGAFDITYAGAGHLYDYRERIKPSDEALRTACACIGWRHLVLDRGARSL